MKDPKHRFISALQEAQNKAALAFSGCWIFELFTVALVQVCSYIYGCVGMSLLSIEGHTHVLQEGLST